MKTLLNFFLTLLLLTFGTQRSFSQMKFGVRGGVNFANVAQNYDEEDEEYETKWRVLYSLGAVMDYSINDALSFQPAMLISAKGFGVDVDDAYDADKGYDRFTVNYLEIPLNVAYKINAFQFYAGPFIAFGISGKNKWDMEWDDEDDSGDDKIAFVMKEKEYDDLDDYLDDDNVYMKRLDYGINFGAGYQVGPVLLSAGVSLGLANITPDLSMKDDGFDVDRNADDYKASTRTISLTATYFFGK
jgi:hypothetical protein